MLDKGFGDKENINMQDSSYCSELQLQALLSEMMDINSVRQRTPMTPSIDSTRSTPRTTALFHCFYFLCLCQNTILNSSNTLK